VKSETVLWCGEYHQVWSGYLILQGIEKVDFSGRMVKSTIIVDPINS